MQRKGNRTVSISLDTKALASSLAGVCVFVGAGVFDGVGVFFGVGVFIEVAFEVRVTPFIASSLVHVIDSIAISPWPLISKVKLGVSVLVDCSGLSSSKK